MFQLSPGVNVTEKDLTTVVPTVATSIGGFAGAFLWGPVDEVTTVASENELVEKFGKPNNSVATHWFSAANFLGYANNLKLVRVVGAAARNAVATGTAIQILNQSHWEFNYINGEASVGPFAAKYPGELGNSIRVSVADRSCFEIEGSGTIALTKGSKTVTGTNTAFAAGEEIFKGSVLVVNDVAVGEVASIQSATELTLKEAAKADVSASAYNVLWSYAYLFDTAPDTSDFAIERDGDNDEMHIVVVDEGGLFTGVPGTVLEKFDYVSKANDAKSPQGESIYYKNKLKNSKYIWWMDHLQPNFGNSASTAFMSLSFVYDITLTGGADATPTDGEIIAGFEFLEDADSVDVNLLITGPASADVARNALEIAETRKDCVAFISPPLDVTLEGEASIIEWKRDTLNPNTSYAVLDSGWKYMYDRYNDIYRWIPLNADVAGLCARTDTTNDPWWSPAGYNRGVVRGVVKLALNPKKTQRDELYKNGINPVASFAGEGTLLFGDKTLLARPSAFTYINVRRLFIVLEKAIATAAKFHLFEFNDAFTRAQFRNLVEPFLRDVMGRRGIIDFRVVCDETNNTGEVIDRGEFIADIYIKPSRSINYISLNFIATRTSVSFDEVVGA